MIPLNKAILVASLAAATTMLAPAASAGDRKVDNASICQPYRNTTTHADLAFRPAGLTNVSATEEYVICPIMVDTDSPSRWTEASPADVSVIMYNPGEEVPTCRVIIGSNLAGSTAGFNVDLSEYNGDLNLWSANIANVHGDGLTQTGMAYYIGTLYCKMPPGSTMIRITVFEDGNTNVPPA